MLIQLIGVLSGIFIVRMLPTTEYAFYTIANTVLGTMTALGDAGISTGMMAQGGKVWNQKQELGRILATGLHMRRKFGLFSLIATLPFLFYLLLKNGAEAWVIALIAVSIIPTFYAQLTNSLLQVILKLHQDVYALQRNTLYVSLGRLGLIGILWFAPLSFIALLVTAIPRLLGNFRLKKIAGNFVALDHKPSPQYRRELLKVVKRVMPGNIYNALSSNIIVFIISVFGSTSNVAEVGALGRLVVIFTVLSMILNILVIPRYAKLPSNKTVLSKYMFYFIAVLTVVLSVILGIVYFFPEPILWVLGPKYSGLSQELFLIMLGAALSMFSGSLYTLMSNRGIIPNPFYFFPYILVIQIITLFFLDLSVVNEVLYFGIIPPVAGIVYRLIYFNITINRV